MADLLTTPRQIAVNAEHTIIHAKEFVHIIIPDLGVLPELFFNLAYQALQKGVRFSVIYSQSSNVDHIGKLADLKRVHIYYHANLNSCVCINEKEAVVTSLSLFPADDNLVQFGVHLKKAYSTATFNQLLKETENLLTRAEKMTIVETQLMPVLEAFALEEKSAPPKPSPEELTAMSETKKLTIREKQKLIVDILARECSCTVKVEDAERIRIQGTGIVIQLSKERVDVAFVRYDVYQAQMEDVKKFITSAHPGLKAGFTYNRITLPAENAKDIIALFRTVKDAVEKYKLVSS